jgi:prepilin-type N-terminal cleavage/methylation domain-containing protein
MKNAQKGFTLIELLTVIGTLGLLLAISLQSFGEYKKQAYYTVAGQTLRDARIAYAAAESDADASLPSITTLINAQGMLSGPEATVLPGLLLPNNIALNLSHNPACNGGGCDLISISVAHCKGDEFLNWSRAGDASELLLEHISGTGGC